MRRPLQVCSVVVVLGALLGTLVVASPAGAQETVTYYEHVLPILQQNCQSCHRSDGQNVMGVVAPMPLMTYEDTRPWARSIAQKVETREMPPWYATEPVGVFANERRLGEAEIETIVTWANAGAPAGDRAMAPPPRVFAEERSGGWLLGTPDFVVTMEPFHVGDDVYDVQPAIPTKIPDGLIPEDGLWVRGWEAHAGINGDKVHHLCLGVTAPGSDGAATEVVDEGAAAASGGLGLGCVAPGTEGHMLSEGWALFIEPGSSVNFAVHYNKEPGPGTGFNNQAEVGFHVAKAPIKYEYKSAQTGNFGHMIPAHREHYRIGTAHRFGEDTYIANWWPHAHLRATATRVTATYPDGTKELLLEIPAYDQGWQETYWYREPKLFPKGTIVDTSFWYDNTSERGFRFGFDADRAVGHGLRTNDEMMFNFYGYAVAPESKSSSEN